MSGAENNKLIDDELPKLKEVSQAAMTDDDEGGDEMKNMIIYNSQSESKEEEDNRGGGGGGGYKPPPGFVEDLRPALYDLYSKMDDDTELWLIQYPLDMSLDDLKSPQQLTLDLDAIKMGQMVTNTGKVWDLHQFPCPTADVYIFQPDTTGTKMVGKVSRHVSLHRMVEPDELFEEMEKSEKQKKEARGCSSKKEDKKKAKLKGSAEGPSSSEQSRYAKIVQSPPPAQKDHGQGELNASSSSKKAKKSRSKKLKKKANPKA